jgi:VanZ family protein
MRERLRAWRFALLYMALIFVISSFEVQVPGVEELPFRDKAIHFVEYGVLGWLCTGAARRTWPLAAMWRTALFAVFVSALWGLSDEIHQALVPGRSAELADVVADLLGSAVGSAAWHLFSSRSVRHYTGKFTSPD